MWWGGGAVPERVHGSDRTSLYRMDRREEIEKTTDGLSHGS